MEPSIIGIDVSQDRLDVHVRPRGETFPVARNAAGLDQLVERLATGWTVAGVAAALGTSPRTVRKWRDRFAAEGEAGLRDRSSRPHLSPARLPAAAKAEIEALRRQRRSGPAIAHQLGRPVSTVGVALRRLGLGRLAALDPPRQVIRYERERPGELIHADEEPADQRHLRALPQHPARRVLPRRLPQEALSLDRPAAGRSRPLARRRQPPQAPSGTLVLRQNADPDLP